MEERAPYSATTFKCTNCGKEFAALFPESTDFKIMPCPGCGEMQCLKVTGEIIKGEIIHRRVKKHSGGITG